jgi:hypothetical protein
MEVHLGAMETHSRPMEALQGGWMLTLQLRRLNMDA